jgi:hypothetical protein
MGGVTEADVGFLTDYVNKREKYKCLGNTIDGNIFNKHNDQDVFVVVAKNIWREILEAKNN